MKGERAKEKRRTLSTSVKKQGEVDGMKKDEERDGRTGEWTDKWRERESVCDHPDIQRV